MRTAAPERGFTLVEVLVALMIIAIGLAALLSSVSGTARTSGILRDKTMAQWIALNRMAEVRLNLAKFGTNTDTGEIDFGGRKWHYDTRYFDTSINSMKRVVVRVYLGAAKTKGNALSENVGFVGTALSQPGNSNVDWSLSSQATNPANGTVTTTPVSPSTTGVSAPTTTTTTTAPTTGSSNP